jgi:hypothetical protein
MIQKLRYGLSHKDPIFRQSGPLNHEGQKEMIVTSV